MHRVIAQFALVVAVIGVHAASTTAATSSTVVSATVPSATSIATSGCQTAAAGVTHFGLVLPGSSVITSADCIVSFGSSNDSSMLRMAQADGVDRAMWARTTGTMDATFGGGDGIDTRNLTSIGDSYNDVAVAASGRVVMAGETTGNMLVASYLPTGLPDTSFGGDGFADFDWSGSGAERATGALPAGDGGVFITGTDSTTLSGVSSSDGLVIRFLPNGSLDPSFGTAGAQAAAATTGADTASDIAFDGAGNVLVVGAIAGASADAYVTRLDPATGAPDATFGVSGRRAIDVGAATADAGTKLAWDPRAGRIYLAGLSAGNPFVAALDSTGSLVGTFGASGVSTFDVGTAESVDGFGVDDLGRLYVSGEVDAGGPDDAWVARLDDTGALDVGYGSAGILQVATGADETVGDIVVDGDGGVVVAGTIAGTQPYSMAITPTGAPDQTYGSAGVHQPAVYGSGSSSIEGVVRSVDGALVLAGAFTPTSSTWGSETAVARLAMPTVLDYASGTADWSVGANMFGVCLRSVGGDATTDGTTWSASGTCTTTDTWHAVPVTPGAAGAKVAHDTAAGGTSTANLRFGFRASATQVPGTYLAPVAFEVLAPLA